MRPALKQAQYNLRQRLLVQPHPPEWDSWSLPKSNAVEQRMSNMASLDGFVVVVLEGSVGVGFGGDGSFRHDTAVSDALSGMVLVLCCFLLDSPSWEIKEHTRVVLS